MDAKTQQKYAAHIQGMLKTKGWEHFKELLLSDREDLVRDAVKQALTPNGDAQPALHGISAIDNLLKKADLYKSIKVRGNEEED